MYLNLNRIVDENVVKLQIWDTAGQGKIAQNLL